MNLVDRRHALVRLAGLIDWQRFATAFGPLYREGIGRPGLPTRLMVGLHLIKHMDGLSDDAVCARFLDSPYVQLFCGETHFQHALPLDRSSSRWRKRIGAERLELLLAETLAAAERAGAAEPKHFERVTIDTTVQPKAVAHPKTCRQAAYQNCDGIGAGAICVALFDSRAKRNMRSTKVSHHGPGTHRTRPQAIVPGRAPEGCHQRSRVQLSWD
ncbi:transposase [Falsiroseomonas sp.]|uniref:transposase n=1 Tax=Falsiroseomonas sp. TaxID=2870721 RepID=UPI0035641D26